MCGVTWRISADTRSSQREWRETVTSLNHVVVVVVHSLNYVRHFYDTIDVARQAPPSTEFSRQEYWSGLPFDHTLNGGEC